MEPQSLTLTKVGGEWGRDYRWAGGHIKHGGSIQCPDCGDGSLVHILVCQMIDLYTLIMYSLFDVSETSIKLSKKRNINIKLGLNSNPLKQTPSFCLTPLLLLWLPQCGVPYKHWFFYFIVWRCLFVLTWYIFNNTFRSIFLKLQLTQTLKSWTLRKIKLWLFRFLMNRKT